MPEPSIRFKMAVTLEKISVLKGSLFMTKAGYLESHRQFEVCCEDMISMTD
jgi:hypothetical protein